MAKIKNTYICQQCGSVSPKWSGRCESCHAWNTLVEETTSTPGVRQQVKVDPAAFFAPLHSLENTPLNTQRLETSISEFDRVCGGGLVPGSVVLVGGDPGIGKSTLLLQIVAALARQNVCAYVSGEEALSQLHMRASRLGLSGSHVHLAASTNLDETIAALEKLKNLRVAIIDSIQTTSLSAIESPAGSVSQVRACALELTRSAKKHGYCVILVGHVTKEGTLAGPRVLEHMVDTVLHFEGDRSYDYRLLRAVKNRFGATDEMGVFSMTEKGLEEVSNPSALFLSSAQTPVSGCAVFAAIEGTRPLFVDIQALVAPSYFPSPRRTAVGWDTNRLAMLLAVLETRCKVSFANKDVYINVSGGLKITEPAVDLAVAAALISAHRDAPLPRHRVYCGEVSLTGEIRAVNHVELRAREALKLGFTEIVTPPQKISTDVPRKQYEHLSHLVSG